MSKRIIPLVIISLTSANGAFADTRCVIDGKRVSLASITRMPFRTKEETLLTFKNAHECLLQNNDRRIVFLDVYWFLTEGLFKLPDRQHFNDLPWYTNLLIGTAERYRKSFYAYETGDFVSMPKVWKLTYDEYNSDRKESRPFDLLLGMNSHITYDIALTLVDIKTDFKNPGQYADFRSLNPYFTEITPNLWDIVEKYENGKHRGKFHRAWKGAVVNAWIIHHRLNAWDNGEKLSAATFFGLNVDGFKQELDEDATKRGKTFIFERPIIRLNQ
ncbi:MAG: DUF5995 family protein [Bacteriovoracaceae bacterium]